MSRFKKTLENHFHLVATPSTTDHEDRSQPRFTFLDDETDLIRVTHPTQALSSQNAALISPLTLIPLIIPLLLFKIITGVINRLLIVGLTLATCLFILKWEGVVKRVGMIDGCNQRMHLGLLICACISAIVGMVA